MAEVPYPLEAPIAINQNFFNNELDITFDEQLLEDFMTMVMVPSENGNARPISLDDLSNDGTGDDLTPMSARQNFLGIAIASTNIEVTVLNIPLFGLIFNKVFDIAIQQGAAEYN